MNEKTIKYDFRSIEKKWAKEWDKKQIYKTKIDKTKPKYYVLDTFVYPSGKGVTIGHYKSFGGMDVIARYKRMKGFNVLYPTGWDTLGLPAENFAIKSGRHPKEITDENIKNYIHQYKSAGLSYDWTREINTADPEYYKWTQWLFLVMYKNGLAYKKKSPVHWCNGCKTVIAKEQVLEGDICERCSNQVIIKDLDQWFFRITNYADRLDKDIEKLSWEQKYINPHKAWIGKSVHEDGSTDFHLRDWCVSRQRYWGPPIPIIYCDKCGIVPIPEKDLPVRLPENVDITPTGDSPLAGCKEFVNTTCPICSGNAKREVDILDTFVSSAWYQYRFEDPNNAEVFADKGVLDYWGSVDHYAGTIEHLTAHLIYARFVTKVLQDLGYIAFDEPFPKYTPVGLLVDKNGTKFSKRLGNAPDTNELIESYGGDLLRLSCQFISPYGDISKWGVEDIVGVEKFRNKVWRIFKEKVDGTPHSMSENLIKSFNHLIKDVEENIESMKYNVALSKMMVFIRELDNYEGKVDKDLWENFIKLLAPFAPFIAEEIWYLLGNISSIHLTDWPKYEKDLIQQNQVIIAIQVNGKFQSELEINYGENEHIVFKKAINISKVKSIVAENVVKIIYVPNKILNIVTCTY